MVDAENAGLPGLRNEQWKLLWKCLVTVNNLQVKKDDCGKHKSSKETINTGAEMNLYENLKLKNDLIS